MKSIILQNLHDVQYRIQHAEHQYGRVTNAVKLLAVSKQQSTAKIRALYEAGQLSFGENYLQEALEKQKQLADLAIEWHFIGHVQSNKTKLIAQHFSWVHTVSRIETAIRLNKQRPPNLSPLNVCIQVNTSAEQSKEGIVPEQLPALAGQIINLPNLRWRGLMSIPAPTLNKGEQRRQCAELGRLFKLLKVDYPFLDTLSMGMSADFEAAIAEGATIIRIGTAIFGERN